VLDGNMCGWFRISGGSVRALAWESFTEEFGNHFLWGHGARKKNKNRIHAFVVCSHVVARKKTSANRESMRWGSKEMQFPCLEPGPPLGNGERSAGGRAGQAH
jgi:hypothetical protein